MENKPAAGEHTACYCTKCKMDLGHTIVAMVGDKIIRVKCRTCGSEHNYRDRSKKKVAAKVVQVTGEVAAVDAAAKTITVKGKKGDVVITVEDKTLADVKAGDKVTAKYTTADNKNTAKSVKKVAAAKKTEKKAETKKAEPAKPAEKK